MRRPSLRTSIVVLAILSLPVLDACAPRLGRSLDSSGLLGGLSCLPIGTRPTQGDIDRYKANLTTVKAQTLQILWEEFDEVVADGCPRPQPTRREILAVHNGQTCPILVLFPIQKAEKDGTATVAQTAKDIYAFYVAKFKQGLDDKAKKKAKARLIAAGLPLP